MISAALAIGAVSCSSDGRLDLSKGWRVLEADDGSFKDYSHDDSAWRSMDLPASLSPIKRRAVFWLRLRFTLPETYRNRDIAIVLGREKPRQSSWRRDTR